MTLTELAEYLERTNAQLDANMAAKGHPSVVTYDMASYVAVGLGLLLLWWVVVHKPFGNLAFIFNGFLWGLLLVEGFIFFLGIPGKMEDQLTVEFLGLVWGVGLVFERMVISKWFKREAVRQIERRKFR